MIAADRPAPPSIQDTVRNMDARAGGASEANEAGATLEEIRDVLTHTTTATNGAIGAAPRRQGRRRR